MHTHSYAYYSRLTKRMCDVSDTHTCIALVSSAYCTDITHASGTLCEDLDNNVINCTNLQ